MLALTFVIVGAVLLYFGGEALVKGAAHLAINLGISPLVVGLTVVSFSTSMPEAVSSLIAQLRGEPGDLALGNVIGSNIANVGLILGITALFYPLAVQNKTIQRESFIMLGAGVLLSAMMVLGTEITRPQGLSMFSLLILYVLYQLRMASPEDEVLDEEIDPEEAKKESIGKELGMIGMGIALLVGGGYLLIDGAVDLARMIGVSERIIGLTVVAIGTSLPELATSLVAAQRKHHEISIGNIVGSNVFNILCVGGGVAAIRPIAFSSSMAGIDIWVMLAFFAAFVFCVSRSHHIGRWQGGLIFAGYLSYTGYLFLV